MFCGVVYAGGMARPQTNDEPMDRGVSVKLSDDAVLMLRALSLETGESRSEIIRECLEAVFHKMGMTVEKARDLLGERKTVPLVIPGHPRRGTRGRRSKSVDHRLREDAAHTDATARPLNGSEPLPESEASAA